LHLLFHVKWISCVTKRMLPRIKLPGREPEAACELAS